ncbi:ATP-binding cassette domain-containing protein [Clostridium beijerinckii]|jgi:ABC-type multidrug transport system, ATPase component|uniref:ABC transporter ATP-binding protein n=2 Tax=Clostridium beijerinckii TaxID=1520 RepID=A0AAE2RUI9_CLOBE|nr:ABC transporter ATP-binding protein [Clostridium beijerinckii]ABR35558.1 ABC transporter related [Clostridium beijerinckii NCIMB 8052]AIU01605.1 ABC transporter related protein [Clostridium beijerinckii ATCC 35702]MBF7809804.1 ABC transporter ATP-binding protein [Clostridium beijerinckii]NRT69413.1 ABC-type multidrug transport system ATPase subunit [Clostridium beijerinckii]NRT84439.1 ABC-type multidrug transport system ATPase subunit [Clostridium beijerinckii]
MNIPIIKVKNLVKKYDDRLIFDDISLDIMKGESIALTGHNGMGKSTLIKILCGLTSITSGEVIRDKNLKFNYIPENFSPLNIKAGEYIKLIGEIEGISKDDFVKKTNYLYKEFNLENMINISMKNLSKGTLQKISVVQALLSKPDILLLDEPLSGQDSDSQKTFIRMVREFIKDGVTVIMSCHELFLIDQLSSRILQVKDSKIFEIKREDISSEKHASMTFYRKEVDKSFVTQNIKGIYDYRENENYIEFKTKVSESNRVLVEMINNGYILKYFER